MTDNQDYDDVLGDKEARRSNRLTWKEISEDMAENRQEMKKVRSSKFANMLKRYENTARGLVDPSTRELIAGATCLRQLTVAVKIKLRHWPMCLLDSAGKISPQAHPTDLVMAEQEVVWIGGG